jgi:hypothetical protein
MDLEEAESGNDCAGETSINLTDRVGDYRLRSKFYDSQSHETVKYRHKSLGTRNQEGLCWREPAAVFQISRKLVLSRTSCNVLERIHCLFYS